MTEEERRNIPTRRKDDFIQLDEKIDEKFANLTDKLARFIRKALIGGAVLGLACGISLIGFGISLGKINQTRKDFVLERCLEQNRRHDNTVAEFHNLAEAAKKRYPKRAEEIERSVKSNLKLIDTLAPKQNCEKLSEVAIGESKPPPPDVKPRK